MASITPAVHRVHRVGVLNDELRRPGERGPGRGAEGGVEHGLAEVVERVPYRVRVLGPRMPTNHAARDWASDWALS